MPQLHPGSAPEAGISPERLQHIQTRCQGWVDDGATPAVIVLAARHGVIFLHEAWGRLGPDPNPPPVMRNSRFGLASVAKTVTAAALMTLVETGRIGLHQPVQKYLPEFRGDGFELVQLRHLLTHTSGLPYNCDVEIAELGRSGLQLQPGREMAYSNLGFDILGEIVQRVSGMPFAGYVRQAIFAPLGMQDATFVQPERDAPRCIQPHPGTHFDWPEQMSGQVLPSSTLWATALDMAIFAQAFLNRGSYGDVRLLSPATVAAMTRNQVEGIPCENIGGIVSPPCGFGWFLLDRVRFTNYPGLWSPQVYGHAGASGAFLWIDPVYDLLGVFFFPKLNPNVYPVDLFVDSIMGAIAE